MTERITSEKEALLKLDGAKVHEYKQETILSVGKLPITDDLLKRAYEYRRTEQGCVEFTAAALREKDADGFFRAHKPPVHVMPAVIIDGGYAAFDHIREPYEHILFTGTEEEIGKLIEAHDQINNKPFGGKYKFEKEF